MRALAPLRRALGTKFGRDVVVSLLGYGSLGVCGLLTNLWIGERHGAETLGVFNQSLSIWVILSQVAAVGLPMSVLHHVAHHGQDSRAEVGAIFSSALILATLTGGLASLVSLAVAGGVGPALISPQVVEQWPVVAPSVILFTIDRMLVAALNARRRMGLLAVVQSGRYAVMLLAVVAWPVVGLPLDRLAGAISVSELFAFLVLLPAALREFEWVPPWRCGRWFRLHLRFSPKVILSDALTEVNSRFVILMLGLGSGNAAAGTFSIVVFLLEGFSQISVVFRNNLNPVMTVMLAQGRLAELEAVVRKGTRYYSRVMAGLAVVVVAGWSVLSLLLHDPLFADVWGPLVLGLGGMILGTGRLPFLMMLAVGGRPAQHLILNLEILVAVLGLCLLLIPAFGVPGAALAYGLVFPLAVQRFRQRVRWAWGMRI